MQGLIDDLYRGTIKADEDGVYRGTGFLGQVMKPFVDEDALSTSKQRGAAKREAASLGENLDDLGLSDTATIYDVRGAVSQKNRERETTKGETAHTRALETVMAPIEATLESQGADRKEERDLRDKQFRIQMEQLRNDRADTKDARADELEYRRMRDRKEDLRYNESIERMDRKDRQQSIQTLVAGLANLGAAFAL